MGKMKDTLMNYVSQLMEKMVAPGRGMKIHLEQSYSLIFKGGIALLGLSLLAISQSYQIITDYDFEIKESTYSLEETYGKPLQEISCQTDIEQPAERATCRLTKYKSGTNMGAMQIGIHIIGISFFLGFGLVVLSMYGFILKALRDGQNKKNQ
ncbi:hypothetical protein [Vibrio metschnikovii]|uniref:hypothetical protein n=1 Tax=Vibrio metschnikovii TaxID=28172 RepID=UPI001CCEFB08|nr:hypothetical protein [Vibrio metschnikovii]